MEVKYLQDIFIKILRSELNETELDSAVGEQLTPDVLSALYSLSKKHDLAHIVSSALYRSGISADAELISKFGQTEIMSVYRCEQMKYAYKQICEALTEASIPYIPLKGSVIRPYYPKESMRTSCDIDVLVKEENLCQAIEALTQKGFKCGEKNYHDVSLFSPTKVHLELHFNILENMDNLDAVLRNAWNFSVPTETSERRFTTEFFVFHMFAHMSYHFLSGGCGIKSLLDVWVMEHKMGVTYEAAKKLLDKAGIYKFAKEISDLADVCFSGKDEDAFSETLLSYICGGGVYGTMANKIAVSKSKSNGTVMYAVKRLFLPYRTMVIAYPVLTKMPFLLPICWILRIFKMIFDGGRSRKVLSEIKTANNVSDAEMDTLNQMRIRLGL